MMIGGLASAGGSVASGIMGSSAAKNAAAVQQAAAEKAAQFQQQQSQNALNFQENEWGNTQNNLAPWMQSGQGALSNLNYLMGIGGAAPTFGAQPTSASPNFATMPQAGSASSYPSPTASPGVTGSIQPRVSSPQALAASPTSGLASVNPSLAAFSPNSPSASAPSQAPSASPTSGGFGSLMQPYGKTFIAPTAAEMEANDPGYQARMQMGEQAVQQSAAARGNLLTGGTANALNQLGQDYASNEYGNYYNQALNAYDTNFNAYNTGQANQFNRLAAMSGMGQQAAGTLGSLGQSAASGVSNNLLSTGQMVGNDYQNAAAANATGIYNSANAMNGMIGGITGAIGNLSNLSFLQSLGGGSNPYQTLYNAQQPTGLSPTDPTLSTMIS